MAYPLYLTVRPAPKPEDIPLLRKELEAAFPHEDNLSYLDILCNASLPRVAAERLGALALLPSLFREAGMDSRSLILRRNERGRPYCDTVNGSPTGFDFNLSHAAAHIAGALLVGEGKVGVDVEEPIPPKRALPLIRRYCSEGELALLDGLPVDENLAARFFTSTWVEREAIAKQEGGGMPLRFDTTDLPIGVTLWSGHLTHTETAVALCAPVKNAPNRPRLTADSLTVSFP